MQILFIHQGFPGQYIHIIEHLVHDPNISVVGVGLAPRPSGLSKKIKYFQYKLDVGTSTNTFGLAQEFEAKTIRAYACAHKLDQLKRSGLNPSIICVHPGWGESLLLNVVFPSTPVLSYQEYFYNLYGFDFDFDPEFSYNHDLLDKSKLLLKNTHLLSVLRDSQHNVTPTQFQMSSFPKQYHKSFSVIHDGVKLPNLDLKPKVLRIKEITLTKSTKIVTFINRTLEPYRGCHTFIRAIPRILSMHPDAYILIVGSITGTSYGAKPSGTSSWGEIFFKEIEGTYPMNNVLFTGPISYDVLSNILRISSCHVYLTYPFVLSWSLLDAMAHNVPIVASNTAPVLEMITDNVNGLLVNFFDPTDLAQKVNTILKNDDMSMFLARNARNLVSSKFTLEKCVPQHIKLIKQIASR